MDIQFSSKLQTHMQNLGRSGAFSPPITQDPADRILHEYFVAETGRSLFDKRRKVALDLLKTLDAHSAITKAVEDAKKGQTGTISLVTSANYAASVTTKSPVKSVDVTALANELIRLGVDEVTIKKALEAATKTAKPAETYTVAVVTS